MLKPNYAVDILYPTIRSRGRRNRLWSLVTGHSPYLYSLAEVDASCQISARHDLGVQTVAISQIQGSGGRSKDFDRNFNLLQSHNRERWLHVAEAQQRGTALPLIKLIRVGELYFVSDGHHRISVARAFGQKEMEARVTVWQVDGTLPWEKSAPPTISKLSPMTSRLAKQAWAKGREVQTRLALTLSNILIGVGMKLNARYQLETVASSGHAQ